MLTTILTVAGLVALRIVVPLVVTLAAGELLHRRRAA
jgi:hypothetical protein